MYIERYIVYIRLCCNRFQYELLPSYAIVTQYGATTIGNNYSSTMFIGNFKYYN
jgi:hypothetical protein